MPIDLPSPSTRIVLEEGEQTCVGSFHYGEMESRPVPGSLAGDHFMIVDGGIDGGQTLGTSKFSQSFPLDRPQRVYLRYPKMVRAGAQTISKSFASLVAALEVERVEDGYRHPAEGLLLEFVDQHTLRCLAQQLFLTGLRASVVADAIHLLGRIPSADLATQKEILRDGFQSPNLEIRDAAAQAAETWGHPGLVSVLRNHQEPVPWLARYIDQVARDLEA